MERILWYQIQPQWILCHRPARGPRIIGDPSGDPSADPLRFSNSTLYDIIRGYMALVLERWLPAPAHFDEA